MRSRDLGRTLACLAQISMFSTIAALAALADAQPDPITRLAGRLEWSDRIAATWPMSGAWMFPVGDSLDLARPFRGRPGYRVSRSVQLEPGDDHHTGADLLNGRAGGTVRAAANGIVTFVDPLGSTNGYGLHVVLGHRLEDGSLVYSVYAHLAAGTIRVRKGQIVRAGQRLARVGRTGRATTNHLHFEVRRPDDPNRRWEDTTPVDPVAFIDERCLREAAGSTWSAPYQAWAATGALLPDGIDGDQPLDEATWQTMRSRCLGPEEAIEFAPASARDSRSEGAESRPASRHDGRARGSHVPSGDDPVRWQDLARDLSSLRKAGTALAPCGVTARRHAARCRERFGFSAPASATKRLSSRSGSPTVGEACMLLADLVVAPPEPNTVRAGRRASDAVAKRVAAGDSATGTSDTIRAHGKVAKAPATTHRKRRGRDLAMKHDAAARDTSRAGIAEAVAGQHP